MITSYLQVGQLMMKGRGMDDLVMVPDTPRKENKDGNEGLSQPLWYIEGGEVGDVPSYVLARRWKTAFYVTAHILQMRDGET